MVPTPTGKPGKTGEHFPVRESQGILLRLEKSGNFTQILEKSEKCWKCQGNLSDSNNENPANMTPYFK